MVNREVFVGSPIDATSLCHAFSLKVKSLCNKSHTLIALHSSIALLENGLRLPAPEKTPDVAAIPAEHSVLSMCVCMQTIAEHGHVSRFFREARCNLSTVKTWWRSVQSSANRSPGEFPANREKYREFVKFCY